MQWNTEENLWRQAGGDRRDAVGRGWAPFLSTLVTLPAAFFGFALAALSGMACDSCNGAEAAAFDQKLDWAMTAFCGVIGVSLIMLVTSWVLPATERNVGARVLCALLAPLVVVVGFLVFTQVMGD